MLDAPVSGSVPQVQSGTLTIMVGGDERAYRTRRADPARARHADACRRERPGVGAEAGDQHQPRRPDAGLRRGPAARHPLGRRPQAGAGGDGVEPDRLADAARPLGADPRSAHRGRVVRPRVHAEGHRARARRSAIAGDPATHRRARRRGAASGPGSSVTSAAISPSCSSSWNDSPIKRRNVSHDQRDADKGQAGDDRSRGVADRLRYLGAGRRLGSLRRGGRNRGDPQCPRPRREPVRHRPGVRLRRLREAAGKGAPRRSRATVAERSSSPPRAACG